MFKGVIMVIPNEAMEAAKISPLPHLVVLSLLGYSSVGRAPDC